MDSTFWLFFVLSESWKYNFTFMEFQEFFKRFLIYWNFYFKFLKLCLLGYIWPKLSAWNGYDRGGQPKLVFGPHYGKNGKKISKISKKTLDFNFRFSRRKCLWAAGWPPLNYELYFETKNHRFNLESPKFFEVVPPYY